MPRLRSSLSTSLASAEQSKRDGRPLNENELLLQTRLTRVSCWIRGVVAQVPISTAHFPLGLGLFAPAPCHWHHGISSSVLNASSFAGNGKDEMPPTNIFTFVGLDVHLSHILLFNERYHQYCRL